MLIGSGVCRRTGLLRSFCSSASRNAAVAEPLEQRALLRVAGKDAYGFLQGLMTNDITHVQSGLSSMYTMFLNTRGRVLYDAIIYQTSEKGVLLIECDSLAIEALAKHLKTYRLRKKVDIDVENNYKPWVVYETVSTENSSHNLLVDLKDKLDGRVLPPDYLGLGNKDKKEGLSINAFNSKDNVLIFRDPRLLELGLRVLCPSSEDIPQLLGVGRGDSYVSLRYRLGVGEGVKDILPDESFPLESNCDFLHGVSFHKGCYIGQELTARIYHTGVIRKRIMPLYLESPLNIVTASSGIIVNEESKAVGKLRGLENLCGIGLLRISEALAAKLLTLCSTNVKTLRPHWWPKQAPKELELKDKL
ncbi:Putative transferase CAF17-like protein, mitochondrial [Frankliniella fusca]|uniref:Transferase CAF17-like protein, mitochondrial n=1 Tax=Frankliniella fusca TaxID=407009 RepID=A0AAE1HS71_9NEOP|nr:Putative transferase CAF17-like protein, mitochondrial [Frankliniella fusca]